MKSKILTIPLLPSPADSRYTESSSSANLSLKDFASIGGRRPNPIIERLKLRIITSEMHLRCLNEQTEEHRMLLVAIESMEKQIHDHDTWQGHARAVLRNRDAIIAALSRPAPRKRKRRLL